MKDSADMHHLHHHTHKSCSSCRFPVLLHGNGRLKDGWAHHKQNGLTYRHIYDVMVSL